MEKLTTWWPDCTQDLSFHNSENWPQKKWEQVHPNWRLTVPKTTKIMLVRPLMTDWRWLLEMTMLFLQVTASPTLSINARTPCLSGEEVSLWKNIHHLPPTVASTWNKANFPFHPICPVYWLPFPAPTHFHNSFSMWSLVHWLGIKSGTPSLGVQSQPLGHQGSPRNSSFVFSCRI